MIKFQNFRDNSVMCFFSYDKSFDFRYPHPRQVCLNTSMWASSLLFLSSIHAHSHFYTRTGARQINKECESRNDTHARINLHFKHIVSHSANVKYYNYQV